MRRAWKVAGRARLRRWGGVAAAVVACAVAGCGAAPADAAHRGDLLYARGRTDEAIAEYKLALRSRGEEPLLLLRLGSAYAGRGDVDAGLEYFRRALELDSALRWQVAAELTEAARLAQQKGGPDNMARALEPVLSLGIGLVPEDLRLELARYHSAQDDHARALPLYLSLVGEGNGSGESAPAAAGVAVMYETARAFRALGGCEQALDYYEDAVRGKGLPPAEATGARWQYGDCLYRVAVAEREAGRERDALRRLDRLIELGVPQTLIERAHYLRGEIALAEGNEEAALAEFEKVLELNPARRGRLVELAEEKIRAIRYRLP